MIFSAPPVKAFKICTSTGTIASWRPCERERPRPWSSARETNFTWVLMEPKNARSFGVFFLLKNERKKAWTLENASKCKNGVGITTETRGKKCGDSKRKVWKSWIRWGVAVGNWRPWRHSPSLCHQRLFQNSHGQILPNILKTYHTLPKLSRRIRRIVLNDVANSICSSSWLPI